jgi:hypothetical protein
MLSIVLALLLIVGIAAPVSAVSTKTTAKAIAQKEQTWACGWRWITDYSRADGGYYYWDCYWY